MEEKKNSQTSIFKYRTKILKLKHEKIQNAKKGQKRPNKIENLSFLSFYFRTLVL